MLDDEKDLFDDLPEDKTEEDKTNDGTEEEKEKENKELTDEEKQKQEEEIRKLTIANKIEDRKLGKLREELSKKREEKKKLLEKKEDEDDGKKNEKTTPEVSDVDKAVDEALKRKAEEERRGRIATIIRKVAKSRKEAERVFGEAMKLPPSGNDELDVKFAIDRIDALDRHSRGFVSPSTSNAIFSDIETEPKEEIPGFTKERIEWLEAQGMKKEDIKKYSEGIDLARVFPRVSKNWKQQ